MNITTMVLQYNEVDNVIPQAEEILATYDRFGLDGEVLIVDDGSIDGSYDRVLEMIERDSRVRCERHDPNRGRSWAIETGFASAKGDVVILLDGDRQYVTDEIPKLLKGIESGYDIANGFRYKRADTPIRRLISRVYNEFIISGFFGLETRDQNSGFKAFTIEAARGMEFHPDGYIGLHRFILPTATLRGYSLIDVPIEHRDREAGASYIRFYSVPFICLWDFIHFVGDNWELIKKKRRGE